MKIKKLDQIKASAIETQKQITELTAYIHQMYTGSENHYSTIILGELKERNANIILDLSTLIEANKS